MLAATQDPQMGLALAVGVLPAVIIGIPARRSGRVVIVVIGFLAGVSIFVGGLISQLPVLVTAVLLLAAVILAAVGASVIPMGRLVLTLCVPLIAAGLSFDDLESAAATMLLLTAGAAYAWLVSLVWPVRTAERRPSAGSPPRRAMAGYGLRMGTAAAIGYLIASGLSFDHPGWAPAACLLVARPQLDLLQTRGVGRVVSVTIGAVSAALTLHIDPPNAVYAAIAVVVLACASATVGSRWYITAGFTTFFVILLASGDEADAVAKTNERIFETMIGVALAYLFGWVLPGLLNSAADRSA